LSEQLPCLCRSNPEGEGRSHAVLVENEGVDGDDHLSSNLKIYCRSVVKGEEASIGPAVNWDEPIRNPRTFKLDSSVQIRL